MSVLTWHCCSITIRMQHQQTVFQAAAAHSLSSDQNQCSPLEWWHACYLLIDLQLVMVKFYIPSIVNKYSTFRSHSDQTGRCQHWPENRALRDLPAFLEVTYILVFFILPFTVPHKIPSSKRERRTGQEGPHMYSIKCTQIIVYMGGCHNSCSKWSQNVSKAL